MIVCDTGPLSSCPIENISNASRDRHIPAEVAASAAASTVWKASSVGSSLYAATASFKPASGEDPVMSDVVVDSVLGPSYGGKLRVIFVLFSRYCVLILCYFALFRGISYYFVLI